MIDGSDHDNSAQGVVLPTHSQLRKSERMASTFASIPGGCLLPGKSSSTRLTILISYILYGLLRLCICDWRCRPRRFFPRIPLCFFPRLPLCFLPRLPLRFFPCLPLCFFLRLPRFEVLSPGR